MELYFSGPNNTIYLVPSETLINPSTLSNLICKGFSVKIFPYNYHLRKYYRN